MKRLKSSDIPNPLDYPGFLIWLKANLWEKYINTQMKIFGITQSEIFQLISLVILLTKKKEVTQTDLVDLTGVSPMSVSKILKALEKRNFITRVTGTDTRSKSLNITESGMEILTKSASELNKANNRFFPQQNIEEFKTYLNSLK